MAGYLLSSRRLLGSHLLSATNQAGLRPLLPIPAAANLGGMTLEADSGTLSAVVNHRAVIVGDGDLGTADYKFSADGGSNYLGHSTVFDNGEGGADGTAITVLADTGSAYPSKVAVVDTDGDGIPDTAFCAIVRTSTTPDQLDIRKTTTLLRQSGSSQSWADAKTDVTGGTAPNASRPVLLGHSYVNRDGDNVHRLVLLYINSSGDLVSRTSVDAAVTWSSEYVVDTAVRDSGNAAFDADIDPNTGRIGVVFDAASTNARVYCRSSMNGRSWSTAKIIFTGSDLAYEVGCAYSPEQGVWAAIVQVPSDTADMYVYWTASADPAASSAAWATSSSPPGTNDYDTIPSLCAGHDGTLYAAWRNTNTSTIHYGVALVAGTYTDVDTYTANFPSIAHFGGAIWMTFYDTSDNDVKVGFLRTWETYSAGNEVVTSSRPILAPGSVYYSWRGGDGVENDTWDIDSQADYGADRMVMLTPSRPARSTADEADWEAIFDATANVKIPVDTIAVMANVHEVNVAQDADNSSWGAGTSVSLVQETVASASVTWAAGKVSRGSGTWTPHKYAGKRIRAAGTYQVQVIKDNDATALYCDADMSGYTGDLQILSDRAWTTQTAAAERYVRVKIDDTGGDHNTAEGYYEFKALAVGTRYALPTTATILTDYYIPTTDLISRGGTITRSVDGGLRRRFVIPLLRMTVAQRDALVGMIANAGGRPLVLIPDSTNSYDFAIVQPTTDFSTRAARTEIELIEVI